MVPRPQEIGSFQVLSLGTLTLTVTMYKVALTYWRGPEWHKEGAQPSDPNVLAFPAQALVMVHFDLPDQPGSQRIPLSDHSDARRNKRIARGLPWWRSG